jgi:hypothetical protein
LPAAFKKAAAANVTTNGSIGRRKGGIGIRAVVSIKG